MSYLSLGLAAAVAAVAAPAPTSPAEPVTLERIAKLPAAEQPAWRTYLHRSQAAMAADKAALAGERSNGPIPPAAAADSGGGAGMPLDRPVDWYAGREARRVADTILSYQTPAGGWGKDLDRGGAPRQRGQFYAAVDKSVPPGAEPWNWVGTIDNRATTTEIAFLARVQSALPGRDGAAYRAALFRGARYLIAAQYPNGAWPQVYPLMGGYHDALTYNDDAFLSALTTLAQVAERRAGYGFVPDDIAAQARTAVAKGIDLILRSQVVVGGTATIWGQQHDALSLAPAGARNFEPAALSTAESAKLLDFLMRLQKPDLRVRTAVRTGVAWLAAHAINGQEWVRTANDGRRLVATPGAGPLWSRYYDIATGRPIFGDRDKSVHLDVNELSLERRNGYAWFNTAPARTIAAYRGWAQANP